MKKFRVTVSYFHGNKCQTNTHDGFTDNAQCLFDNAINDAQVFARTHGGQVNFTRKIDALYINYLDIPNTNLIDRQYLVN